MLQHTYLIHTLNMQDECTNKEWSWAFPNPILTFRILQLGLAQEKPSFHEPPCPPSSWALPPSLQGWMGQFIEHFNGPPIELFNITFNPWHTKANILHLNSMQLTFNYIFNNKINYYYKLRSKLSHDHPCINDKHIHLKLQLLHI